MANGGEQNSKGLYRATSIVASGTFLSRILGLVREQVFAFTFGAGAATDAFQIAFRIPNLLRDLFAEGAMSSALVPTYTKVRKEKGETAGWKLVSQVINLLLLILLPLTALGVIFSTELVQVYAPAFFSVEGKAEMTIFMTQILWPFLPLVVLAAIFMGILNARERFGPPALAPSFFNLASIAAAFTLCPLVFHWLGWPPIYGMALGAVIGGLLQWLVQVPSLRGEGFRYSFSLNILDPDVRRMVALMGAGTFGLAATQINILVNSFLASSQGDGAVSWLNYAFRLMQFPIGVFGVAIATVNLTKVAKLAGDPKLVAQSVEQSLRLMMVLAVPSAVGLAVLGIPIIGVIYEHGAFTSSDTYATAMALAGYALGLTAYSGIKVLVPVLYALGMARSAIWSSGLSVAVNIVLCFQLIKIWGFVGLACATSVAAFINMGVLLVMIQARIKQINFNNLLRCLGGCLFASLLMAIIVYILQRMVGILPFHPIPLTGHWVKATFWEHLIFLIFALGAALVVYGLCLRLLGFREIHVLQEQVWKRFAQRKGKV